MNETATGTQTETQPTECEGMSPNDAGEAQFEHIDEYQVPVDPMADLKCDSCQ